MKLANIKVKIRTSLDFLLTLFFFRNVRLLFSLLRVQGLSSFVENEFLFRCSSDGYGEGLIVEIGCYRGRSTISLALGSQAKRREKVYAIDPHNDLENRELFIKNIKGERVEDYVIADHRKSEDVIAQFNSDIRLLFIDGSHIYEDVKKDILLWKGCLIDGGMIALHDYLPEDHPLHRPDVKRAIDEFIINSGDFIVEGCIDSILFASKAKSKNKEIFGRFSKFHEIRRHLKSLLDRSWLRC